MTAEHAERPGADALWGHGVASEADVTIAREQLRRSRLSKALLVLLPLFAYLWWRVLTHDPVRLPRMAPQEAEFVPIAGLIVMLGAARVLPVLGAGRSPHVLSRPEELDTTFYDVKS